LLIHIDVGVVPTDRIVGIDNNLCVVGEMTTNAFAAVMQAVIKQKRYIDVTADCFILLFIQLFSLVLRVGSITKLLRMTTMYYWVLFVCLLS
jgi:hypothetical protein